LSFLSIGSPPLLASRLSLRSFLTDRSEEGTIRPSRAIIETAITEMTRRYKTAIFRHTLLPLSETFIAEQVRHLHGVDVVVLGIRFQNRDRFELPAGHVINPDSTPGGLAREILYVTTGRSATLDAAIAEEKVDLIHAHFGVEGVYALPFALRHQLPLITTFWGFDATLSRRNLLLSGKPAWIRYGLFADRLRRRGALFIAVSEFLRGRLLQSGFPPDRTIVHYNGVDLNAFAPSEHDFENPTILSVGRLVEKKGIEYLIEAFALVARELPEVRLEIAGDGPLRPSLERLSSESGLSARVTFHGSLSHAAVAGLMREASIFCQPSVTASDGDAEGLPTVVLEAAATAKPLVGTLHSGIPEIVADGKTGFLVAERDVGALADRLLALLRNSDLRRRMGEAGRKRIEEKFDLRKQAKRLEEIYGETIARFER
jgi:glycosyltransferase involved in cell wall biosynthesis